MYFTLPKLLKAANSLIAPLTTMQALITATDAPMYLTGQEIRTKLK